MNRPYEALVIVKSLGTEDELAKTVGRVEEAIKRLGGSIDSSRSFGRRRLAYRILRQTEGYYHLLDFQLPPEQLGELKRQFRLNETILRFLILVKSDARQLQPAAA